MLQSDLELVSIVTIPAITTKFVAKDKFRVNKRSGANKMRIVSLDKEFKKIIRGRIEEPKPITKLYIYRLQKSWSHDGALSNASNIAKLGGLQKAATTLGEIFYLMEKQEPDGSIKHLANYWKNIFFVTDQEGRLCPVGIGWGGRHNSWCACACASSVSHAPEGIDGYVVFSRNSLVL